jgi:hypothetical protein
LLSSLLIPTILPFFSTADPPSPSLFLLTTQCHRYGVTSAANENGFIARQILIKRGSIAVAAVYDRRINDGIATA